MTSAPDLHLRCVGLLAALALGAGCSSGPVYHANTAPTPQQHDTFFPISLGSVGSHGGALAAIPADQLCTTCHDATSNSAFSESVCTSCHTNANGVSVGMQGCGPLRGGSLTCTDDWHANQEVGGYQRPDGGQETCIRCHANDEVWRVADHSTRVIGIPFDIENGIHAFLSCLVCHPNPRDVPEYGHAAEPWATDFVHPDCTACHLENQKNLPQFVTQPTDPVHVNPPVPGYTYGPTACVVCHVTGNYLDGGPPQ
jgi:hypothetical protein